MAYDISPTGVSGPERAESPFTLSAVVALILGACWLYYSLYAAEAVGNFEIWSLNIASEDRLLESAQAWSYLAGFLVCVWAILRRSFTALAIVWLVLTFFFLGEEISWGQRIFDYSVPAVEAHNVQNEFNLHNLAVFTYGGLRSAEDWQSFLLAFLDIQFLFQAGFYSYFYVLPLLLLIPTFRRLVLATGYVPPSARLIVISFLLILGSYIAKFPMHDEQFKDAVVEVRETVFALTIALYLLESLFMRARGVRVAR